MSFFQVQPMSSSNVVEFKVHNLIYDLAKYMAGNEFLTIANTDQALEVTVDTRHALVDNNFVCNMLPGAPKLCSLNLLVSGDISVEALRRLVLRFRHLKILNLSGSGITRIHKSIGDLIYLRYLDLSNTPLEALPRTIGNLCNLLTLDLSGCIYLLKLPKEIIKLDKLTHLNIKDCARLARLPLFSDANMLQTLPIVIVDKYFLQMLSRLRNLRGELKIKYLEKASGEEFWKYEFNAVDGNECFIKDMDLQTLELYWGDSDEGKLNQNTSRQIRQTGPGSEFLTEMLQPSCNIRRLSINGYPGYQFPDWMNPYYIRKLTELELIDCKNCETLPKLGPLPSLKCLKIQGMDNVVKINNEFSGEGMTPFPSLNELYLRGFPQLRTWDSTGSTGGFPCLQRLSIMKCPLLKTLPLFPTLQHLKVQDCDPLLLRSEAELRTLLTLVIDSFPELHFISKALLENCLLLMSLTVISCPNLQTLPTSLGKITSLKSLKIGWCKILGSLPDGLANLISLENLEIIECPSLITLPEQSIQSLSSLRSLCIENCNGLISLPSGIQHVSALERLTIMYCSNLGSLPDGLQTLLALKSLTILRCPELASLPEGVQHMNMLQNLEIRICPKLMALPKINNLISLRSLAISDCQNIKSLPEGIQQLSGLQHLSIQDCPELEERCKIGSEDWQKISHIPFVYIGTSALQNRQDIAPQVHR